MLLPSRNIFIPGVTLPIKRSDGVMEWCYFRLPIFDFGFKGRGNFKRRSRAQKKIMVRLGSNYLDLVLMRVRLPKRASILLPQLWLFAGGESCVVVRLA